MAIMEKFAVYWLGYHQNPPTIQSLPSSIDQINLFLLNLCSSSTGTTIDHNYITSKGTSWETILSQAKAAQANGPRVCVSLMPPNSKLIWNTIPDPETFAENVYNQVTSWGLNGIDIDPEQGNVVCNQTFINVVKALSKYFGPASSTGLSLTMASYIYSNDEPLLKACADYFNWVALMGYGWDYDTMVATFKQYANAVDNENLMFGIGGDPWQTPLSETQQLANWEPSTGHKGGMMEFNINDDANFASANAIIEILAGAGK